MLKKTFIILFVGGVLFAQSPAKKWVIIQDLQDRIVYMDTSAIKEYENQISVWGLTIFRIPQRVTPFTEEVAQIKSNLLFNTVKSTYSVIGTLYYARTGAIIGESEAPRITGGENNFELPIQPGSSIEALYQKGFTYKTTGNLEVDESEFLSDPELSESNNKDTDNLITNPDSTKKSTGPVVISAEQNIALIDEANIKTIEKRDSVIAANKEALKNLRTVNKIDSSNKTKTNPPSNKSDIDNVKLDSKKSSNRKSNYDTTADSNVRGNIWSDGNRYVIQISSWREKSVAEKLVKQKNDDGHNAFVMRAEIPGRGTWYRVRVGYFNTLEEAQNYKRTNRL